MDTNESLVFVPKTKASWEEKMATLKNVMKNNGKSGSPCVAMESNLGSSGRLMCVTRSIGIH